MLKVYEFLRVCHPDAFIFIRYEREKKITEMDLSENYGDAQGLLDRLSEIELNYYIQHFDTNPHDSMIITLCV